MKKYFLFIPLLLIAYPAFAAISFDAKGNWNSGANVSQTTTTITIAGANELLFGCSLSSQNDATATYAGTAMTLIASSTSAGADGRFLRMFMLPNPATGTNLLTFGVPASEAVLQGGAAAYIGAAQVTIPDASSTFSLATTTVTSATTTVTTVANNSWGILCARFAAGQTITGGTNTTLRTTSGANTTAIGDSNAPFTPAGSYSMNVTDAGGTTGVYTILASFAPSTSTPTSDITIQSRVSISKGVTFR